MIFDNNIIYFIKFIKIIDIEYVSDLLEMYKELEYILKLKYNKKLNIIENKNKY